MTQWIAEDLPWYLIDKDEERPWRDEDMAMSAPQQHGKFPTEAEARKALAARLDLYSTYSHVKLANEWAKYRTAAEAIRQGADGVRLSGRYYRVREI